MQHYDLIVIGGGPSGMMAAGQASKRGKRVLLLEKNRNLGKKLSITGGGRCNILNSEKDVQKLLDFYGPAKKFLFSPFSQFGVKETFSFFESRKLPIVVEARKRAFPKSQKAEDVTKVMKDFLNENGVVAKTKVAVKEILWSGNRIDAVVTKGGNLTADNFLIATGGVSRGVTGSTGDGFKWLAELGHTVKQPTPDIVPIAVKNDWVKELSGVSLSFMKITFFCDDKKAFSKTGKILFTHFGLSGPLILNSAREVKDLLQSGYVTAKIDAYPDTDHGALDKHIQKVFDQNKNKDLKNILAEIVPAGMAESMLFSKFAEGDVKVHSVSKESRKEIVNLLKALPINVTGLMGFDRAVVADGGVSLAEIDTKTMRSRKIENLFVTGDMLDVNRPSGGYSLQLCWTTGFVAGNNV